MKIIHLNTFGHTGGAGIAASRLVNALNEVNPGSASLMSAYETSSNLTFRQKAQKFKTFARSATDILFSRLAGLKKENIFLFSSARYGQNISDHPSLLAADIIHIHWINQGFLSIYDLHELSKLGKPVVITMHDMWLLSGGCHYSADCKNYEQYCGNCFMLGKPGLKDLSAINWKRKQGMLRALKPVIITCSHWLESVAAKSKLLESYNILTIPNPIDTDFFKPSGIKLAKIKLGFKPEELIITLSAFKLSDPRKGFSYFLDALAFLKKNKDMTDKKIRLVLIGNNASTILPDLPYPAIYTGYLSNPAEIIAYGQASDLFVLPSLEDNLPNTVVEMLAMGVPVVAFNTGGLPDLIDHKQNGYLAFYKSAESLAKGMAWIISDLEYSPRLRKEARKKVMHNFEKNLVADQYIQVYQKLLPSDNLKT